jgi:signal transduction histidine kinase
VGALDLFQQDMSRVFLNIIGNGIYAMQKREAEGGGAGYRPELKVSTRDLGEWIEARVRDNGPGIPDDVRDKVFSPFFTTKPAGEGTGLGLSLSYDIVVQQHGGQLEVDSEPASFTEFIIRLPRQAPPALPDQDGDRA